MRGIVAVLLSTLLIACVLFVPQVSGASSNVIFSANFDAGLFPGVEWTRGDNNLDSGYDYWSQDNTRAYSGNNSLWCAHIGTNHNDGDLNTNLRHYDTNMSAWITHSFSRDAWNTYRTVTLTFYLWAETGKMMPLDDYFFVTAGDARNKTVVYNQTTPNTDGWVFVEITMPSNSTWFTFNFVSGENYTQEGPFEGAYIDGVLLVGSNSASTSSRVSGLGQYQTSRNFSVPYSPSTVLSFGHIELFYRGGIITSFSKYAPPANPSGNWSSSPIPFEASSDGKYDFFTIQYDSRGIREKMKTVADASTYIDTIAPETEFMLNGTMGLNGWYRSEVIAKLLPSDDESGLQKTEYSVDYNSWVQYGNSVIISETGTHHLLFRSVDKAGNVEMTKDVVINLDVTPPEISFQTVNGTKFTGDAVISWAVGSESGLLSISASVDGESYQSMDVLRRSITIGDLRSGSHNVSIRIEDIAGNTAEKRLDFMTEVQSKDILSSSPLVPLAVVVLTFVGMMTILTIGRRRSGRRGA